MENLSVFTKTKGFLSYEEFTYSYRYGMVYERVYFNQKDYMNYDNNAISEEMWGKYLQL